MGPGYFPLMLGVLLAVLGAAITLKALSIETSDGDPIGKWAWKPLILVLSSVVAFGVLIVGVSIGGIKTPQFGIVVAIFALTILASMADEFRWRDVLILAGALSLFSYLVFVLALKLPFPMLPSFMTR
jgi:Tripartite tricarboxylate transporter TctB family